MSIPSESTSNNKDCHDFTIRIVTRTQSFNAGLFFNE